MQKKGHYSNGPIERTTDWESDSVRPFSNEPKDKGLYIATTYDDFFRRDVEQRTNGQRKE